MLTSITFAEKKQDETVINTSKEIVVHPEEINTRTVSPCPVGGSHNMLPMGIGYAVDKDTGESLLSGGVTSQCEHCKLFLLSEYDPAGADYPGAKLGDYTFVQLNYFVSFQTRVECSPSDIYYNSDMTGMFDLQNGWIGPMTH